MKPFAASDRKRVATVAKIRAIYEKLIEPMRETARAHGYALAVHGSGQRDIDILAAPWTESAAHHLDLLSAILKTIQDANGGCGWINTGITTQAVLVGEEKPHGRRAWSIQIGHGTYVDLSVMPRAKP